MRRLSTLAGCCLLACFPLQIARRLLNHVKEQKTQTFDSSRCKQLLVDVSVIYCIDAGTGIQRVVRALLNQLLNNPPHGYDVRPVYASRAHGYRYASSDPGIEFLTKASYKVNEDVTVAAGDIFLGLDMCAHLLPKHRSQLHHWKLMDVEIHIIVYDLLPVLHPHWFRANTTRHFKRWLKTITLYGDNLICISNTVRADLEFWMSRFYDTAQNRASLCVIQLGADVSSSVPSKGIQPNSKQFLLNLKLQPTALMVGTVEPRKGYNEVVEAFEILWHSGYQANLVIVGRSGWKTERLQEKIRNHKELGKRLFWLSEVSDELLEELYRTCVGLIAASFGEGYGLPIIEAAHYAKPVLARDIPVFREIAGPGVSFFATDDKSHLPSVIKHWLTASHDLSQCMSKKNARTWRLSAQELLECMGICGGN